MHLKIDCVICLFVIAYKNSKLILYCFGPTLDYHKHTDDSELLINIISIPLHEQFIYIYILALAPKPPSIPCILNNFMEIIGSCFKVSDYICVLLSIYNLIFLTIPTCRYCVNGYLFIFYLGILYNA